jgi:subtilisin family serine protease
MKLPTPPTHHLEGDAMANVKVIVELKASSDLQAQAFAPGAGTAPLEVSAAPKIAGVSYDPDFSPVAVPGQVPREQSDSPYDTGALFDLALAPDESTYIVRAEVDEAKVDTLMGNAKVAGVFSDPIIEPCIVCPGSPAVGNDSDVERLLCAPAMHRIGMDGQGVLVAIVDSGINVDYLVAQGKTPTLDAARSWVPQPGLTPGQLPVGHGTMCAFDVLIAAPKATLLDVALLQSTAGGPTPMSGVLSDAVRAYRHLIGVMTAPRRPGEARSLVVNNSWGMFHPTWDFPVGHPGNYSDNPNHPFNRIVGQLERAGADILFAAGNCGPDCPDGRCQGVTANAIYGANSHPAVLSVAGVDTTKQRVGYSSVGPGRLTRNKPDISGYTHFRGSGVYPADGGTSAATPVVAGVVAAVRSKRPYDPATPTTHPTAIRTLLTSTADDLGAAGYDFEHGYGVVNGCALQQRFRPVIDICKRYPWLCEPPRRLPFPRRPIPFPPPGPRPGPLPPPPRLERAGVDAAVDLGLDAEATEAMRAVGLDLGLPEETAADPIEMSYIIGWLHGEMAAAEVSDLLDEG